MNSEMKLIANRIKELRGIFEISVSDMAVITGVSEREYIECENGKRDLSFTFLHKCAGAFKTDISALVTGNMPRLTKYSLLRDGEGMPIKRREGFEYQHMAPMFKNRLADPFTVIAKYSEKLENEPIALATHKGQEFDYVLEGQLKVEIDGHIEILNPGDKVFYNSALPHGMIAVGGADCKFISVVIKGESSPEYALLDADKEVDSDDDELIYRRFAKETLDERGRLVDIAFNVPDNFNFAYDVLDELAKKCPDKLAMLWLSHEKEERRFSYSELSHLSSQAANYLASLGVGQGDRVMLVLKRHYQFWVAINAIHKLGAVAIPATHLLTTKDFEYRFNAAGVKAIICTSDGETRDYVDEAAAGSPDLQLKICVNGRRDGWFDFDEGLKNQSETIARPASQKAEDASIMFFTSGTTGYPKIATHSFTYPIGHIVTARYWHNVDPEGIHFTISDTGWGKALWGKIYGQWFSEAAIFTYDFDKFSAGDILPLFAKYNITTFCAPPTMYRFFIKEDLSKYDLSSIQYATTAGEALNLEVFEQFKKATGLNIMEGFGQTETTLTVGNLVGSEFKPGSMGKPTPQFNIDLINADGKTTKVGEVGEIVLRTDKGKPYGMFSGYFRDEKKTKEAWHDNVYHTGDTAWRDEDGYFWYYGRTDDLIKSSGYRIGPFEIESVIMELPYVLECAITAAPDETRGQVVKATVVLTKGTSASDTLKKEIQTYVKEHTAPYKYPRIVEFVDELPKTISGKIRRVDIRSKD